MSITKKIIGASLATTAAVMFTVAPMTATFAHGHHAKTVKCYGVNKCKGHSACKTMNNKCKGQNKCKGKGFVMVKSEKKCQKKGGRTSE